MFVFFYLEWDYSAVVNHKLDLILNLPKMQLCIVNMGRRFTLSRRVENFERKTQAQKKRPPHRPRKRRQQGNQCQPSQPVQTQTPVTNDLQVT